MSAASSSEAVLRAEPVRDSIHIAVVCRRANQIISSSGSLVVSYEERCPAWESAPPFRRRHPSYPPPRFILRRLSLSHRSCCCRKWKAFWQFSGIGGVKGHGRARGFLSLHRAAAWRAICNWYKLQLTGAVQMPFPMDSKANPHNFRSKYPSSLCF